MPNKEQNKRQYPNVVSRSSKQKSLHRLHIVN